MSHAHAVTAPTKPRATRTGMTDGGRRATPSRPIWRAIRPSPRTARPPSRPSISPNQYGPDRPGRAGCLTMFIFTNFIVIPTIAREVAHRADPRSSGDRNRINRRFQPSRAHFQPPRAPATRPRALLCGSTHERNGAPPAHCRSAAWSSQSLPLTAMRRPGSLLPDAWRQVTGADGTPTRSTPSHESGMTAETPTRPVPRHADGTPADLPRLTSRLVVSVATRPPSPLDVRRTQPIAGRMRRHRTRYQG